MSFQEGINFHSGIESQEAAHLSSGKLAGTGAFKRDPFERRARQIGMARSQMARDVFRQLDRDLHVGC